MSSQNQPGFSSVEQLRLLPLLALNETDAGNAEALAKLHGHRLRFDHTQNKWVVWNLRYWVVDETGEADRAALDTARQRFKAAMLLTDAETRKDAADWSLRSESTFGRRAMLASAESIKELATVTGDYDRDPFLFTVENGTLDLRTAKLRDAKPEDLITKASSVKYAPNAQCPRWTQFLDEVFLNDVELIRFVQRAVGYSLTGDTREQCLFILHGGGANGKSTFLEIVLKLVGTHGAITSFSTFLVQQHPGSPRNDVAKLHGARLVKAAESQKQAALDEATVKEVTGGDTISARFLFREFFDFRPQFKIWLTTNHRPTIYGTDDAIWRRIRLIPFNAQFTGKKRDPKLRAKLELELPGILAWAVQGCLEWQRVGLGNAPAVELATLDYRRDSDHFGRFLAERCSDGPREHAAGKELFDAYVQWCAEKGERPESNNNFAKALADRGKQKKRTKKGTVYMGVGLRPMVRLAKPPQINSP
jgi:putative DNA primase/helicase